MQKLRHVEDVRRSRHCGDVVQRRATRVIICFPFVYMVDGGRQVSDKMICLYIRDGNEFFESTRLFFFYLNVLTDKQQPNAIVKRIGKCMDMYFIFYQNDFKLDKGM